MLLLDIHNFLKLNVARGCCATLYIVGPCLVSYVQLYNGMQYIFSSIGTQLNYEEYEGK